MKPVVRGIIRDRLIDFLGDQMTEIEARRLKLDILESISRSLAMTGKSEERDRLQKSLWELYESSVGPVEPTTPTSGST